MSGDSGRRHVLSEIDDDGVCGTITVDPNVLIEVIQLTAGSIVGVAGIDSRGRRPGRLHSIVEGNVPGAIGSWHERRGSRVSLVDGELNAQLTITVESAISVPDVAREIQTRPQATVERLLGFTVGSLSIHVTGIVSTSESGQDS